MNRNRVLIIYYSFSSQTQLLVQRLASGLEESGAEVVLERVQPVAPLPFPFPNPLSCIGVMITSFFRKRVPITQPRHITENHWDLVIVGGPTWSYNPSGPILHLLDKYGDQFCAGRKIIPLISCRSYWRTHYRVVKRLLASKGATVEQPVVFQHQGREPWLTIGLFLQIIGRLPRKESSWFRQHYPRYGHTVEQFSEAVDTGRKIGAELARDADG